MEYAKPDAEATYKRLIRNRRTNLGVLVLLAAVACFGYVAAIIQSNGGPFRFGVSLGIGIGGTLALATFSVLLILKPKE